MSGSNIKSSIKIDTPLVNYMFWQQYGVYGKSMTFSHQKQHLRIEIHILSLHWMMKNISYFDVWASRKNWKSSCFSSSSASLKYEFQSLYKCIYVLYYQSNWLNYLPPNLVSYILKWNISFVTEVLEQPGRKICGHNVMALTSCKCRFSKKVMG